MITPIEIGWAAGFIEGEGCVGFATGLRLSAAQKQLFPLYKLKNIFGGKVHPNCKISTWDIHGANAAQVIMTIFALMSPRRQASMGAALGRWKLQSVANKDKQCCPRGHRYDKLKMDGKSKRYCSICESDQKKIRYRLTHVGYKINHICKRGHPLIIVGKTHKRNGCRICQAILRKNQKAKRGL